MWPFTQKRIAEKVESDLDQPTLPCICRVRDQGTDFLVSTTTPKEAWRAKTFVHKEAETNEWLRNELETDSVFWDIGANIGLYSLYAAKLRPSCCILAFEPESQNFASLCKNVFINDFKCISALNIAVSGGPTSISDIYISEIEAGSSIHNLNKASPWSFSNPVFVQKVFAASADELVNNYNLPAPTILKIDVDGIELDILKGCENNLIHNIKTILVEIDANNDGDLKVMTNILNYAGFKLINESIRTSEINNMLPRNYIWKK